jgi:hypothetical protein
LFSGDSNIIAAGFSEALEESKTENGAVGPWTNTECLLFSEELKKQMYESQLRSLYTAQFINVNGIQSLKQRKLTRVVSGCKLLRCGLSRCSFVDSHEVFQVFFILLEAYQ